MLFKEANNTIVIELIKKCFIVYSYKNNCSCMFVHGVTKNNYKEMFEYYKSFASNITDDGIITAVEGRQKNKDDELSLNYCIAAYICSDSETREILEEELSKDDFAIKVARSLLNEVEVEVSKTSSKTEEKSKNGYFVQKEIEKNENKQNFNIISQLKNS